MGTNYNKLAQYYDLIHAELTADIAFILSLAPSEQWSILDLGCGTGRLVIPFAREGHIVYGLDASQEMLAIAKDKAARESTATQSRITWLEGDMTRFRIDRLFNLITISHNTLHEFKPTTAQNVLDQIKRHLEPDGILLLDLSNPFHVMQPLEDADLWVEDRTFHDPETDLFLHQRSSVSTDHHNQIVHVDKIIISQEAGTSLGNRVTDEIDFHILYPHEIELMLEMAGLRLIQLVGGYSRQSFSEESERMLVLARHSASRSD